MTAVSRQNGLREEEPLRVLLIEDNPGDARLFEEYLGETETDVVLRHEQCLDEGLQVLSDDSPEVLVLDLGLPDSQGPATVEAVAASAPEVPIVVLTGQKNLESALRAQEAGATEYLQKEELTPTLVGRTLRWAVRQDRMRAELRQRDAWIRSLTENVSAGMFRAGPTGRIRHANEALLRMLGIEKEEELIGQDLTTLSAEPTQQGRMLAEEGVEEAEITLRRTDGTELVGLLSAEAAYDASGEVLHYDGVITDITEQKNTLRKLEKSEKLTHNVLDALAANVAVIDGEGTIIDVNDQWRKFAEQNDGHSDAIGVGINYLEVCRRSENDEASVVPEVEEGLRSVLNGTCDLFEYEYPCHGPDEERWFLMRATPLDWAGGGAVIAHINITSRVQAGRKQRMLSEAVAQTAEAVLITEGAPIEEPGPQIVYANSAFEEMTGYAEEEVLGKTPRLLQGPETDRSVLNALREALEAGEEWEGETVNYRKDGTPYVVEWNVSPVWDTNGAVEYWVSVQQDVTEQREREKRVRRQKNLLEQTQRLAGAWSLDLQTEELSWSEKMYEIYELPPGTEVDPEAVNEFVSPESRPDVREAHRRCVEDGTPYDLELPLTTANGQQRWVRAVGGAIRDQDGEIIKITGALQDITDRKQAEQELRRSRERYRSLFEDANDAILVHDLDGHIQEVNPHAEALFGLSAEELGNRTLFDLHPPEEEPTAQKKLETLRAGDTFRAVTRYERADGTMFWGEVSANVADIDGGGVVRSMIRDVTERKEMEEDLRAKEAQFRGLSNSLPGAVYQFVVSPDGTSGFHYVSEQVEELLGLPPDPDTLSERGFQRIPESHRERLLASIDEAVAEEKTWYIEIPFIKPSGERIWLMATSTPERRGEELLYHGVILDITERKEAEQALREERDLLDRIFEVSPVAIVLFNKEGEFVRASDRAQDILGLPKEDITTRTYNDPEWEITTPDGEPVPDDELPFARVISTDEPLYDVEHTISWPNGKRRLLSVSGAPLHSHVGDLEGAVFHIEDITERRKIEDRFQGVFENAGLGIALLDETGTILEANPTLESMLGYDTGGLNGLNFEYVTHPEDIAEDLQLYEQLIAGDRTQYQLEKRYLRRDGETFWGHLTVSRREVPDGVQVVGMVENIDDRKQRKRQLRAAKEEAERMNRLKSAFLANMSHEIRTPLTSVLGFAEAIGEEVDDSRGTEDIDISKIIQFSGLIERGGRRLMETLNSVLQLSKLQAGEMNLSLEPVDLVAEVTETAEEFEPQAKASGIDLQVSTGTVPIWARADEGGLRILLRNLLSNAIKYTGHGGEVWVRVHGEGDIACLEVEDTGIGMDPEAAADLFEAFKQESEGMGREYEGAGLGLTVTREVLNEMGGSIQVETEKGKGSCFTVQLQREQGGQEGSESTVLKRETQ